MGSTIATISSAMMTPDMIRFVFVLCILNMYVYSSIRGILISCRKSLGNYTCIQSLLQEIDLSLTFGLSCFITFADYFHDVI